MRKDIDLIHGSLWDKILLFALPVAATGLLQQLFNAADVAIIGRFAGTESMAAIGGCSPIVGLLIGASQGVAMGGTVVIANFTGRGDKDRIGGAVDSALLLAMVIGLGVMGLGELIMPWFLRILAVPEEIMSMAVLYMRLYLCALPLIMMYNFQAAIFRSQGDARTPLLILAASGFIKVGLNLFFVLVLGMGVAGVAVATLIANVFSSVAMFILLHRTHLPIRMDWHWLKFEKSAVSRILQIGAPAAVQNALFSVANLTIQSAINGLGPEAIAGSAAAVNIEILIYFLVNSYGQAATTFVGQNYGAGDIPRCRKVTRLCLLQDAILTTVVSLTLLHFGTELLSIFNTAPVVLAYGKSRIAVTLAFQFLNVPHEIMSATMRGYGTSLIPAVLTLFGVCGVRIFWVKAIFPMNMTLGFLLTCFPISWVITGTALLIAYAILWKVRLSKQQRRWQQERAAA